MRLSEITIWLSIAVLLTALVIVGVVGPAHLKAQDRPTPATPLNTPEPATPLNALPKVDPSVPTTPPPPEEAVNLGDAARISTTVRIVMAPVTVTDKNGGTITGLAPTNFKLYDNGRLQRITEDVTTHPLSLVVVVQANSEMEKVIPQIQKLGSLLQAQVLGDDGEAAVIGFDHRIQTLTDEFTSNPDKITAALKKLKPGSSSARLNDATIEAINMLKRRPTNRRRVILLIAENRDQGSELRAREVLSASEFANVVIYSVDVSRMVTAVTATPPPPPPDNRPPGAVHITNGEVMTPTLESQQVNLGDWTPVLKEIFLATKAIFVKNPLDVYTRYSGGREYGFIKQATLDRAVSDLGDELHSQYLLTYTPNNQDEAGFHNIVVTVDRPDFKIRTRDGYYLAGTPEGAKK